MGNFNHNIKVLQLGTGELIVARRPTVERYAEEYLPCLHCLVFIHEDEVWRHTNKCPFNSRVGKEDGDEEENSDDEGDDVRSGANHKGPSIKVQCRVFLEGAANADKSFTEDYEDLIDTVINKMRHDHVKTVVEKDSLILKFGSLLLAKVGHKKHDNVAEKMRRLGRFLIEFQKIEKNVSLTDVICGTRFDAVIKTTRELSCVGETTTMAGVVMLSNPSAGLHLGYSLKKCALIKRGKALRVMDDTMLADAQTFLDLFNSEWVDLISSNALASLKEKKYNCLDLIPMTDDLQKLQECLDTSLPIHTTHLTKAASESSWRRLSEIIFATVTLFNKRRGGEVARMPLCCFTERPQWNEHRNQDVLTSLSPLEQRLMKNLDMVHLPGKRNRRVPLLLKKEWVTSMQVLVEKRKECNVNSEYFFGVPGSPSHLAPWKVMNQAAKDADCSRPDLISTTRLRKYTATVTQIMGLKPGEIEWLSNHLGHTVNVHKDWYRLHESTIEMAKVSKVLIAIENGQAGKFKGKSIDEIQFDEIDLPVDEVNVTDDEEDVDTSAKSEKKADAGSNVKRKEVEDYQGDENINVETEACLPNAGTEPQSRKKRKKNVLKGIDNVNSEMEAQSKNKSKVSDLDVEDKKSRTSGANARPKQKVKDVNHNYGSDSELDDSDLDENYSASAYSSSLSDSGNETMPIDKPSKKRCITSKQRTSTKAPVVRWTGDELAAVEKGFKENILNKKVPRKHEVEIVMAKYPVLNRRPYLQIKSKVHYIIRQRVTMGQKLMKMSSEKGQFR
ncbi:uncharacterized protein LOC135488486 [Lineus longissimus]|uniref:uncharacterized protein LOC135488486 n=1 Tax=Lineus longissimus TaxID=88925 RepID=UPI00315D931E